MSKREQKEELIKKLENFSTYDDYGASDELWGIIELVEELQEPRAIKYLIRFFGIDEDINIGIIKALNSFDSKSAAKHFVDSLGNTNYEIENVILQCLAKLGGTKAVFPIIEKLRDYDGRIRNKAKESIRKLAAKADVEKSLKKLLESDKNQEKFTSAIALGLSGNQEVIPILKEFIEEKDTSKKLTAIQVLVELGEIYDAEFNPLAEILLEDGWGEGLADIFAELFEKLETQLKKDIEAFQELVEQAEKLDKTEDKYEELRKDENLLHVLDVLPMIYERMKNQAPEDLDLEEALLIPEMIARLEKKRLEASLEDIRNRKKLTKKRQKNEKVWEEVRRVVTKINKNYQNIGKNFVESGDCQEMMGELYEEYREEALEPLIYSITLDKNGVHVHAIYNEIENKIDLKFIDTIERLLDHENVEMKKIANDIWKNYELDKKKIIYQEDKDDDSIDKILLLVEDFLKGKDYAKEKLLEDKKLKAVEILIEKMNELEDQIPEESFTGISEILKIIEILPEFEDSRVITPIMTIAKNQDIDYYRRGSILVGAFRALGKMNVKQVIEPILALLADKDLASNIGGIAQRQRADAMDVLGLMKAEEAVLPLIEILNEKFTSARIASTRALGNIGDKRAAKPLMKILEEIKDDRYAEDFRETIVSALAKLKDPSTIDSLVSSLDDDWEISRKAEDTLKEMGDTAVERIQKQINAEGYDSYFHVIKVLGEHARKGNKKATETLLDLLKHEDWHAREYASNELGEIGDTDLIVHLQDQLKIEEDGRVKDILIIALGKLGDKSIWKRLLKLWNESEYTFRYIGNNKFANALVKVGEEKATKLLLDALNKRGHNKSYIIRALALTGDKKVVQILIDYFNSGVKNGRAAAAIALGNMGDERAIKPLLEELKITYPRQGFPGVIESLVKLQVKEAVEPLKKLLKYKRYDFFKDRIKETIAELEKI